jgi:hypothetical protein
VFDVLKTVFLEAPASTLTAPFSTTFKSTSLAFLYATSFPYSSVPQRTNFNHSIDHVDP